MRFDPLVAAAITISVVAVRGRPALAGLAGLAAAAGAAIKVWPALLDVGLPGVRAQRARHTAGDDSIQVVFRKGSWEYVGPLASHLPPFVSVIEYIGFILTLAVLALGVRTGRTGSTSSYTLTCTAVISLVIATSPVLSTQYLIWLGPSICVLPATHLRRVAYAACLLTQLEYPFLFDQLFASHGAPQLLLALIVVFRDVLLLALAALAIRLQVRTAFPGVPRLPSGGFSMHGGD